MKKATQIVKKIFGSVIAVAVFLTCFVAATADTYVTDNDPLVSLSYITDVLTPSLKSYVDGKIVSTSAEQIKAELLASAEFKKLVEDEVKRQIAAMGTIGGTPGGSTPGGASSTEFSQLTLRAGQKITAIGKCEIIVQSGSATVISRSSDTVRDITAGTSLSNGSEAPKGHFIEISYGNGSGIASTWSETVIQIRGEYTFGE